jgi:hypothetical protein
VYSLGLLQQHILTAAAAQNEVAMTHCLKRKTRQPDPNTGDDKTGNSSDTSAKSKKGKDTGDAEPTSKPEDQEPADDDRPS